MAELPRKNSTTNAEGHLIPRTFDDLPRPNTKPEMTTKMIDANVSSSVMGMPCNKSGR